MNGNHLFIGDAFFFLQVHPPSHVSKVVYGIWKPGGTQYGDWLGGKKTQPVFGGQLPANFESS
jgi:hypothetical protein